VSSGNLNPAEDRGTRWTASPSLVAAEIERVKGIEFFEYEDSYLEVARFTFAECSPENASVRELSLCESYCQYPREFPAIEPKVFDHDKVFVPTSNGQTSFRTTHCVYTFRAGGSSVTIQCRSLQKYWGRLSIG